MMLHVPDVRGRVMAAVDQFLDDSLSIDWQWGEWDCVMAAANVLRGPVGCDPAAGWRGRYTTPRGYLRVLRRAGHASLAEAVNVAAHDLGWRRVMRHDACKGDIGIAFDEANGARACVLNLTPDYWVGFRHRGHGYVPTAKIEQAWCVA